MFDISDENMALEIEAAEEARESHLAKWDQTILRYVDRHESIEHANAFGDP